MSFVLSFLHSHLSRSLTAVPGNIEELADFIAHDVEIRDTYIEMKEGWGLTVGVRFDLVY